MRLSEPHYFYGHTLIRMRGLTVNEIIRSPSNVSHSSFSHLMSHKPYITTTKNWIEKVVIGLNLCPFAKPVFQKNKIQYTVSPATTEAQLLEDFVLCLQSFCAKSPATAETAILILPFVLADFEEYLDFFEIVEQVIIEAGLEGIIQAASFHPAYQFEGTTPEAIENYTNRSPYPLIHLLREDSIEKVRLNYPDIEAIPERNMETMRQLEIENGKLKIIDY